MTLPSPFLESAETSPVAAKPEPEVGSVEYWRAEATRLRELWGQKTFWESLERANRAYDGLVFVWANTRRGVTRADELAMAGLVNEWTRRLSYALRAAGASLDLTPASWPLPS